MSPFDRAVLACAGGAFVAMTEGESLHSARMSDADNEILNDAIGEMGGKGVIAKNAWHRAEGIALDHERPIRQLAAVLSEKRVMAADDIVHAIHSEPSLFHLRSTFPKPVAKPVTPRDQFPDTTVHLRPSFPMSARGEGTTPRTTFAAFGKPSTLSTEMTAGRIDGVLARFPRLRKNFEALERNGLLRRV